MHKRSLAKPVIIGSIILAGVAGLILWSQSSPPPVNPPLPSPNGYDSFAKPIPLLTSNPHENNRSKPWDPAELRGYIQANLPALELVRSGLKQQCRVPIDYKTDRGTFLANHVAQIGSLKRIASLMIAEAELAEREVSPAKAAQIGLDTLQFGQDIGRGGLIADRMVALACESMAVKKLNDLAEKLDAKDCRAAAERLAALIDHAEPAEPTLAAEANYFKNTSSLKERLLFPLLRRTMQGAQTSLAKKVEEQARSEKALLQLLQSRLDGRNGVQ